MSKAGNLWFPITRGVGAVAFLTIYKLVGQTNVEYSEVKNKEQNNYHLQSGKINPVCICTELMEEPVSPGVKNANYTEKSLLEESYCELSPIKKVDSAWDSWEWFSN